LKLTAHTFRVKQISIAQLFLATLLTGLGLFLLWESTGDEEIHIDHFGRTLADSLASQVQEPIQARNLIYLGVLANRAAALPEVLGASIHGIDNELLAVSGDVRRGRTFPAQVVQNGRSIGVVRVHIDAAHFETRMSFPLAAASLLWVCLVPLGIVFAAPLARQAQAVRLRPQRPADADSGAALPITLPEPEAEPEHWDVIIVNLFNQLSLSPELARRELDFARGLADRVADAYGSSVRDLPGTGLLLSFGPAGSDDRPFHVLSAAFVLSRLLADGGSRGRYRLSVHSLTLEPGEVIDVRGDAVRDAAVLSALARDNDIALSLRFFNRLPHNQRLVSEPMQHPLLDELGSTEGGARLARDLADPHREVLLQRLAELSGDEDDRSTASESTF
jgi:hypothetical protein